MTRYEAGANRHFGPADRATLRELAERAGATAWLVDWPIRHGWRWMPSEQWP